MNGGKHNVQKGIHDTLGFKLEMIQVKRVKLFGKLPSLAKNMLVRTRTYIDSVRARQAPAKRLPN